MTPNKQMLLPNKKILNAARESQAQFFLGENNRFKRNILQAGLIQCGKTFSININKRLLLSFTYR